MDKRRLIGGLSIVVLVVGLLLVGFSPGGLFNSGAVTESVTTPFGSFSRSLGDRSSSWPIVGYVLSCAAAAGLVVAIALQPPKA
jgi:hypothetical protein